MKRGPKDKLVEELRKEVASLEARLRSLSVCSLCSRALGSIHTPESLASPISYTLHQVESDSDSSKEPHVEKDFTGAELVERMSQFSISAALKNKFYGSASTFALANSAMAAKEKITGQPIQQKVRRSEFWEPYPWEQVLYSEKPQYIFPEKDLLYSLIQRYFEAVHPTFPLIHRPSFELCVAEGMHFANPQFGSLLLALLGVASRHLDDPRVLLPEGSGHSAGWKFVSQVRIGQRMWDPSIFDAQFFALMCVYALGTSTPQTCWLYLGMSIRYLQHLGEHRRKRSEKPTEETEICNRTFWAVLCLDRTIGAFIGRPLGLHPEEYDADLPLEVDDEYWQHDFVQPPNAPASITFFIHYIQLCEILGDALRRLYASRKCKLMMGWKSAKWDEEVAVSLDSRMNQWLDGLPSHLRWRGDQYVGEATAFDQCSVLYTAYNFVQIMIHRPFIQKDNSLASPSLAICVGAARCIIQAIAIWVPRRQLILPHHLLNPLIVAALVLCKNIFGAMKRSGSPIAKDFELVETAQAILKSAESRWQSAGRLWEILETLKPGSRRSSAAGNGEMEPVHSSETIRRESHRSAPPVVLTLQQLEDGILMDEIRMNEATLDDNFMAMWLSSDLMDFDQWNSFVGDGPTIGMW
ncbi:unnamed protein product [Mycena citricolor]|uniref:Xylanolytic transcriptional activator regulatory domain-containing protein n=1 Tax=Mycena citricolor TaxID=2018698 RepID=A0AAD2H4D9_9AGAR|nr:unnamed protein product [Mycena citricolor]